MANPEPLHFRLGFEDTIRYYAVLMQDAHSQSEDHLRNVRRQLGETDLFFFIVNILKRVDMIHPWLFDRCREVQREPNGRLDLWARYHFKSSLITHGLTIFDIVQNQNVTIGIFSHSKKVSKAFLKGIKETIEQNEDLSALWPEIFFVDPKKQAPKWSEDEGITVMRTAPPTKECTVEAHGLVDGMPTGKHFMVRIYDDVVTPESVSTPEQIHKTTHAFRMSSNLGMDGGLARYIGTRYHLFDTYRAMIDDGIAIPRIYPATVDGTEFGDPVLLSPEHLAQTRKEQGPFVFSSQMLLNPVADKAMGFRRQWLVHGDTDYNAAMRSLWRFIIVDPASRKAHTKNAAKNDYTSMWVVGYGHDENFRVLDMVRDRMNLTERTNMLIALHQMWKPGLVAYEEYGKDADIEHIQHVQKEKLYEFPIHPLGGGMKKELRILRLIPLFENGFQAIENGGDGQPRSRIILPTSIIRNDYQGHSVDLVKTFVEEEYTAFPVLAHDDMMDGLARIVDLQRDGLLQKPIETLKAPPPSGYSIEKALKTLGGGYNDGHMTA